MKLRVAMETIAPLPWQPDSFLLFSNTSPNYLKNYDKGSFTYYVISRGEGGGGFQMLMVDYGGGGFGR